MPDSGQGSFDGDGSVKWEVVTEKDVPGQSASDPDGAGGRKSKGVDDDCKTYFRVMMKVPADPAQRLAFLAQFNVQESGGEVEVRLPLEKRNKQIRIKWNGTGPLDLNSRSTGS